MNQVEAYQYGKQRGREAYLYVDAQPGEDREEAALEAEENSRQYHDFVNGFSLLMRGQDEHRQLGLWEAYEKGVADGIKREAKKRQLSLTN